VALQTSRAVTPPSWSIPLTTLLPPPSHHWLTPYHCHCRSPTTSRSCIVILGRLSLVLRLSLEQRVHIFLWRTNAYNNNVIIIIHYTDCADHRVIVQTYCVRFARDLYIYTSATPSLDRTYIIMLMFRG